jgi:hypothetical protein
VVERTDERLPAWQLQGRHFRVVAAEIEPAPEEVRSKYDELKKYSAEVVEITDEVVKLANTYEEREIFSPGYRDDGLHIAAATVHEIDILTSWNFKHIVHYEKIRKFNAVNREFGYRPVEIRTPREVTNYGPEE